MHETNKKSEVTTKKRKIEREKKRRFRIIFNLTEIKCNNVACFDGFYIWLLIQKLFGCTNYHFLTFILIQKFFLFNVNIFDSISSIRLFHFVSLLFFFSFFIFDCIFFTLLFRLCLFIEYLPTIWLEPVNTRINREKNHQLLDFLFKIFNHTCMSKHFVISK